MSSNPANLWVLLGLGIAGIILVTKRLKKKAISREDFGAFIEKLQLLPPPQPAPPKAPHPLTGLSFAVSDLFDIEGYVTGFGHPDWARSHEAASLTAAVVLALVEGGATCTGKCVIDELAYGINGESKHFGTPTNPAAPARIPGGPSSGAAVAVAANLVDFALGLDTVGGVRVPAGYCGIIGFRPSHGAVPHAGVVPVAASLDSVGWFAKEPSILRRVGHVLLNRPFGTQRNPRQIVIADDCFQLLKVPAHKVAEAVIRSSEKLFGRQVVKHEMLDRFLNSKVPSLKKCDSKKSNGECKYSSLVSLANVMRLIHRFEFKSNHEEWISLEKPPLDPTIATEINETLDVSEMEIEIYKSIRTEMREAINSLLKDDGILVIPTTAYLPPKLGAKAMYSEEYLTNTFSLQSIASLSGCCQVSVPLGQHDKCPVSVSLIARHGGDRFLLDTVQNMYAALQGQFELLAESRSSGRTDSQEKSAEMAKEKGNQAFKEKQWQKAIGYYTEAIKLNGKTATYYSNRAAVYLEIGSFLQAEADCTKAIDLDKKNVKAYLRRGTAREMLGYYKEAIEDFRYASVLEPTNKRASDSVQRLRNVFQ